MNSKKLRLRAVTIALMAAIIALRCVNSGQLAGTITQSGNGFICGKVVDTSGSPDGVRLVLLPESYDPVKDTGHIAADIADASGNFAFENISPGNYVIVAVHAGNGKRTVIRDVHVYEDRTDSLAADTLRAPGSIRVMAPSGANVANGYLYIAGTPTFAFLKNSAGFAVLDSVAAGKPVTISYSTTTTSAQTVLRYGVQVAPGDTAEVWNTGWNYARKITLNTSATGAGVTGNVISFPVLIRLTEGNLAFTQARNNGEDIRFTKRDNTFLPYEIERWDAVGKKAEVWVRVDTVRGSDSAQSIIMYWGNADAPLQSASESVFDTAQGFQGVWHMGQMGNTTALDATANRYDGTPSGMSASSSVEGAIGGAQRFDGASSYIALPGTASGKLSFPQNGTYTLSAWVYTEVIDSQAHYIISKSNKNYNLDLSAYNLWEIYSIRNGVGCESNFTPPHLQQWKYLTGVRNGTDQRIYVDGICVDSSLTITTGVTVRDSTFNVQIGKRAESAYGYWNGMIDEVIIANVSRSADWIRLSYMNQKEDDKLVVFK